MNSIFEFSPGALAGPLTLVTALIALVLLWKAVRAPHLLRIGMRNVPRRKLRTALVVFGLMLATTFVACAIAIDYTLVAAVKTVAVYNLGRVDEEVVRPGGSTTTFSKDVGALVRETLVTNPYATGIAPGLRLPNALVADKSSRQIRGGVTALAIDTSVAGSLDNFSDLASGRFVSLDALPGNEILANRNAGRLLNANPGDTIFLYSSEWPGKRYAFTLRTVVSGGLLGDAPAVVLTMPTLSRLMDVSNAINVVYIANAGDGLSGVVYSDGIANDLRVALPEFLTVHTVKADGVATALRAQDIFGRILVLFTLFAFAIGLLLIFLIFSLLAAERRAELGIARAIGMRRSQIILMLLFEGSGYDLAAACFGVLTGLSLGLVIVSLMSPAITRLGYPLTFSVEPEGMLVAFCLGALFTLGTILLSAWNISRMTVAAALRDLPEPPAQPAGLMTHAHRALARTLHPFAGPERSLEDTVADAAKAWLRLLGSAIATGIIPIIAGIALLIVAFVGRDGLLFALGVSATATGLVLLLRIRLLILLARRAQKTDPASVARQAARDTILADRLATLALGGGLALYWSLPYDATQRLGLPHFTGSVPLVFVAGMMMVFGAVIALAPNLDLVLPLVSRALGFIRGLRHVTSVALIYPALHRFRTGVGIALFSLVCFTLVVMACIAASVTSSYGNVGQMAAGYDISGQPLFRPIGGSSALRQLLHSHSPAALAEVGAISSARPVPVGVIQPGAPDATWRVYPASEIDGAFLDGAGLPLAARAQGFASDADVWQAVRTHPGDVVIDASALSGADADALGLSPAPPVSAAQFLGPPIAAGLPGLSNVEALRHPTTTTTAQGAFSAIGVFASDPSLVRKYRVQLHDVALGAGVIMPTTLWVGDLRSQTVSKVTVIGVIDNTHAPIYGMLGSSATFAPIEQGLKPFGGEYYYIKVKHGAEARNEARALGSALLDWGFETTDLRDLLLDINGPRIFLSRILVGLVGLTLLVGMAALAVTGSRAVVERRQQIGMLRAIGFRRAHIQAMFFIESLLVGVVGAVLGLGLGLLLCRNVFAVNFFAAFTTDLDFVVPWGELALICGVAVAASVMAALVPAWQANRIAPADALRYE